VRTLYYRGIVDVLYTGPARVIKYMCGYPVRPAAGTDIQRSRDNAYNI
jgi:hypothetical protein